MVLRLCRAGLFIHLSYCGFYAVLAVTRVRDWEHIFPRNTALTCACWQRARLMDAVQDEQSKLIEAIRNLAAVIAQSEQVDTIIRCIDQLNELERRLTMLRDDQLEGNG